MRLLKVPMLILVSTLIFFTSCEPTYEEFISENLVLLRSKTWKKTKTICGDGFDSDTNLKLEYDFNSTTVDIEYEEEDVDNSGNTIFRPRFQTASWYVENYSSSNAILSVYIDSGQYREFDVITLDEDKLVIVREGCIVEFE